MPLPSLSSYSYYEEPVEVPEDCMVPDNEMLGKWMYNKDLGEVFMLALVVWTHLIAAIVAVGALGTIALCRPGAATWSVSAHEDCRWLSHMVFFQGKLYTLDSNTDPEELIAIDIVDDHDSDEPRVSQIERLIEGAPLPLQEDSFYEHYLLEPHGTLLMIRKKISYKTEHPLEKRYGVIHVAGSSEFEVFEADFEQGLWSEGLWAMTKRCSLGENARDLSVSPYDLSRDCLFFLDDYADWLWKKTTSSCRVYDMKDEKVYSPLPMVSWKSGTIPATWLFSQDKLQTTGEHLHEIVEPEEVDALTLLCEGACAVGASTSQQNC